MSTITNSYNVAVQSRFYTFLQEDIESTEPQVLIASAERKRELLKENKTKAKKDKRTKQIADAKKEITVEDLHKVDEPVVEVTHVEEERSTNLGGDNHEEKYTEQKSERGSDRVQRGRGSFRRGGREVSNKNDENVQKDELSNKSSHENYHRSFGNNRSRPYQRERTDEREDSFNKVGFFDEHSKSGYRGGVDGRRPYARGMRYSRGSDRTVNEDCAPGTETSVNVEAFENDRPPYRSGRGRYPRVNRGSFNRFNRNNNDDNKEFEQSKIGYFDENVDNNNEYRGNGRARGGRGPRRGGRGDYRRAREHEPEVNNKEETEMRPNEQSDEQIDDWGAVKDDIRLDKLTENDYVEISNGLEQSEDRKDADWGEIEDDSGEVKVDQKITMTLDEWKAQKERTLRDIINSKEEIRKANDGRDVFSGMSEYRKGKGVGGGSGEGVEDTVVHETQVQETVHVRVKQTIPVAVRFSRCVDHSGDVVVAVNGGEGYEQGGGGNERTRGREGDSGGGRGRGRPRTGYENRGGRDYGRGRGRGSRGNQYGGGGGGAGRRDHNDNVALDVSINLGNEDEFPHLS